MCNGYVLIGAGDFAVEIVCYLADIWHNKSDGPSCVTDIVSSDIARLGDISDILGSSPILHEALESVPNLAGKLCIVAIGDPRLRYKFMLEMDARGGQLATVIHPTAYVASTAAIGDGAIICPMAFVGPFAKVGRNCVINVSAVVGHDALLGECAVMSPGSDVNGHGGVGEGAFLGAGAIVHPKAKLGAFGKLSAGSVLNRATDDGFLMHGNPAVGRKMFRRP